MFRWYYLVAGFFLYDTIGAFSWLDRLIYGEWDFKEGDKLSQGLTVLVIFAGLALFWRGYHKNRHISTGGWLLIALAIFLILSAVWSINPPISAKRGILFLLWSMGIIGIASNLEGNEFLDLFGNVCLLCAVLSLALLAISPNTALMAGNALRGTFSHKSVLGQAMSTGALLALYRIRTDKKARALGTVMLLLFTGLTLAAQSMTSMLTIAAFVGAECVIALVSRGGAARLSGIVLIILMVPSLALGALFPDQILEMLGKDTTLTGRSDLWAYVLQAIAERPILGWGVMAFWSTDNPIAVGISTALGWIVPQSHNGLLELLLSVGIVGTLFFAALLTRNALIAFSCLSTKSREVAITLLLCCMGILLIGAAESVLIDPAQPAANILFVGGLICERRLRAVRQRRTAFA